MSQKTISLAQVLFLEEYITPNYVPHSKILNAFLISLLWATHLDNLIPQ